MSEPSPVSTEREEPPPLGSWSRLYLVVILALVLEIALLGWITAAAR